MQAAGPAIRPEQNINFALGMTDLGMSASDALIRPFGK